jgi:hypothetical protein
VRRGKATVTASALHTLWDLKLRILEALSVHPKNADVYCLASGMWTKLDNDDASLAGAPTAPGSPLLFCLFGTPFSSTMQNALCFGQTCGQTCKPLPAQ